ncbi:SapC family protein [Marinobacterium nitratireducens]|nr:SapC family protein [Marinobacterium nitratireducens]
MSKQLLYYGKVVPVSFERHGGWYIKATGDYSFTAESNSVPITVVEFTAAALEYPIVFAESGDTVLPVAMLGVKAEHNLFVDSSGAWLGHYIPAFVRRYPFVFSKSEDGDRFYLCVDEEYAGCNTEGRGERLFDSAGERTQYLGNVLNFVQEYQVQFNRTQAFCSKLKELGLLESMQAQLRLPGGEQLSLTGFQAVSREKLKALPAETLEELVKRDEMELIYTHLLSLRSFTTMAERVKAPDAPKVEIDSTESENVTH